MCVVQDNSENSLCQRSALVSTETSLEQLANKHHVPEIFKVGSEIDKDTPPLEEQDMTATVESAMLEV